MVRHGTLKKRRRGLKVTRKRPKHPRLKIIHAIKDETAKNVWDRSRTPIQNLKSLGLDPNPNELKHKSTSGESAKINDAFLGFVSLPDDGSIKIDKNLKRRIMSKVDQQYAARCIEKYGTNFKAMERDTEINYDQHSEHQIKKMCEKYLSLPSHQILVPRP